MTAVLTRARAELRARVKPMVALILLVGLGSAAVMTLAAGARRTDTAYPRFARAYKAADMLVYPSFGQEFASLDFNKVAKLPQVAVASVQPFVFAQGGSYGITVFNPPYGTEIDRMKVLEGKLPKPTDADALVVSHWNAKDSHWHLGSVVTITFGSNQNKPIPFKMRVVAIVAVPGEFPPQIGQNNPTGGGGLLHITPAGYRALLKKDVFHLEFLMLRFKRGAKDNLPVNAELNELARNPKTGAAPPQLNDDLNSQAADVQRSIHLEAFALWLVAGLAGLIIVLVLSQLLARQATIDSTENPTLLALGMSRQQVWLAGMWRALIVGVAGAAIGVVASYLLSPLMPFGLARIAEPTPGLHFDVALLGVAAGAVIVLVLALAAWPVWKNTRLVRKQTARSQRPTLAARAAAAPGFPPPIATGVRLALESGKGRTEVPVRSSLFSVVVAVVALAAALTFGASLDHLLTTPRLYGVSWDVHLTTDGSDDNFAADNVLKQDPRVQDLADVGTPPVLVNGKDRVDAIGLDQVKGRIAPILIDGRLPELPTEVALGVKTLRDAHVKIGGTVRLSITAVGTSIEQPFKVVGTTVLPPNSAATRLGTGVVVTGQAFTRMVPPGYPIPPPSDLYFTFVPGVDKKAALADILSKVAPTHVSDNGPEHTVSMKIGDGYGVLVPVKPTDLVNFGNVQNMPLLLAGLVGLLAAATLAHILVTAIRRRRRDLAILKMLGFVPGQVRFAVAPSQATTFVAAALVIGVPVGIAVGRVVWSAFATNLGTVPEPVTPSIRLLVTVAGTVLLANLIAILPAIVAGRMRPAPALRAE